MELNCLDGDYRTPGQRDGHGGPDYPGQMIALCPNCHAMKTRGRSREELRPVLLEAARQHHDALLDYYGSTCWHNAISAPGATPRAIASSALAESTVRTSVEPPIALVSVGSSKYMSFQMRR